MLRTEKLVSSGSMQLLNSTNFASITVTASAQGWAHTRLSVKRFTGVNRDTKKGKWGSVCESWWAKGEKRSRSLVGLLWAAWGNVARGWINTKDREGGQAIIGVQTGNAVNMGTNIHNTSCEDLEWGGGQKPAHACGLGPRPSLTWGDGGQPGSQGIMAKESVLLRAVLSPGQCL